MVALLCSLLLFRQAAPPPFEKEILQFEAQDAKAPPKKGGIVFVGSSSIVRWKTLAQDFPGKNVLNRGFGGSEIADSVRYTDRIVTPYKPTVVVLFAGTNDIANGKNALTVFSDYKEFVEKAHGKLPRTPVVYISITPSPSRWDLREAMRQTNELIAGYVLKNHGSLVDASGAVVKGEKLSRHPDLVLVDVYTQFISGDQPRPELFVEDKLHGNASAYAIWTRALGPVLAKL